MSNVLAFCESSESGLRTSALANVACARRAAGQMVDSVEALVDKLHNEAKVI